MLLKDFISSYLLIDDIVMTSLENTTGWLFLLLAAD